MAKIAIDCLPLQKNNTGIGFYIATLLKELILLRSDDHFYLYTPYNDQSLADFESYSHITIRICASYIKKSLIWGQIGLPLAMKKDKIDLLWATNHIAPFFCNSKILLSIYDFTYKLYPSTVSFNRRWFLKVFTPLFVKKASAIITCSYGSAKKLKQYHNQEAIKVIYPPIRDSLKIVSDKNASLFLTKEQLQKGAYLLVVGTLEPRKNLEMLLLLYKKMLENENKDTIYPLVIVGGAGWNNLPLLKLLNDLKNTYPSHIHVKGYVTDDELSIYLHHARYFLFLSLYEGFGMPIAEARSLNTAVIATDSEELKEAADNDAIFISLENELQALSPYLRKRGDAKPKLKKKPSYPSKETLAKELSEVIDQLLYTQIS